MRPSNWRELMPEVRAAAEGLAQAEELEICQRGKVRWLCLMRLHIAVIVYCWLPALAPAGCE